MSRFIAVDPSSTYTGWAVFEDDGLIAWGLIDTRASGYAGRFTMIVQELSAAALKYGARSVAIEDIRYAWHSKYRNRNIAGLQVVYRSIFDWAKEVGFLFYGYNPATWKAAVIGHPNATKEVTKANCLLRFQNLPDNLPEHVYDAIAIGVYHAGVERGL